MKGDVRLRVFKFQLWVSGRDLGLLPPAPSTHPESVMGKCNPMAPNAGACVSLVGYDMRRGGVTTCPCSFLLIIIGLRALFSPTGCGRRAGSFSPNLLSFLFCSKWA